LTVVLQIAMNFHHVVEPESTIDDRLERAARETFEDKFDRGLPPYFIAGREPDAVPLDSSLHFELISNPLPLMRKRARRAAAHES
jgi:hypothetical protein